MTRGALHLIAFDLRSLAASRLTWLQVLFLQAFLARFSVRMLPGPGAWADASFVPFALAWTLFVLNAMNHVSFEFTFSKVLRFRIAENLLAAPVGCRTWLLASTAACFAFNAGNLALHAALLRWRMGPVPLGGPVLAALLAGALLHLALLLGMAAFSLWTGLGSAANNAVFLLTVAGTTALGFCGGLGRAGSPAAALGALGAAAAAVLLAASLACGAARAERLLCRS